MTQASYCLTGLVLLVACGEQGPTSSTVNRDPDLTGRYQSTLSIRVFDSASYPFYSVVLGAECPSEWVLNQTKPREYAVAIHVLVGSCSENPGFSDYLTLAPTITGVLNVSRVGWNSLGSESLGVIRVGNGTAQEFQSLTGCIASGIDNGWHLSFQAYTTPDYTFQDGWGSFFPVEPLTRQGEGAFYVQCRGVGGLSISMGFNYLRVAP